MLTLVAQINPLSDPHEELTIFVRRPLDAEHRFAEPILGAAPRCHPVLALRSACAAPMQHLCRRRWKLGAARARFAQHNMLSLDGFLIDPVTRFQDFHLRG